MMVPAVLFRESIQVGTTQMSPQRVQQVVQEMGETYKGNAYHLLQRNCNHFSNDLCQKLTGQQAPLWVSMMQPCGLVDAHCMFSAFYAVKHDVHCITKTGNLDTSFCAAFVDLKNLRLHL